MFRPKDPVQAERCAPTGRRLLAVICRYSNAPNASPPNEIYQNDMPNVSALAILVRMCPDLREQFDGILDRLVERKRTRRGGMRGLAGVSEVALPRTDK
jgi:hypothetical protein